MDQPVNGIENGDHAESIRIEIMLRAELVHCRRWQDAFVGKRKDHRFYELVEDTVRQGFDCNILPSKIEMVRFVRCSALLHSRPGSARRHNPKDTKSLPCCPTRLAAPPNGANHDGRMCRRRRMPRWRRNIARVQCSASSIRHCGPCVILRVPLIVLKEFPARHQESLKCFLRQGFSRVPSLPMTCSTLIIRTSKHTCRGR